MNRTRAVCSVSICWLSVVTFNHIFLKITSGTWKAFMFVYTLDIAGLHDGQYMVLGKRLPCIDLSDVE